MTRKELYMNTERNNPQYNFVMNYPRGIARHADQPLAECLFLSASGNHGGRRDFFMVEFLSKG